MSVLVEPSPVVLMPTNTILQENENVKKEENKDDGYPRFEIRIIIFLIFSHFLFIFRFLIFSFASLKQNDSKIS